MSLTLHWDHADPSTASGFRVDVLDPTTRESVASRDVANTATSLIWSELGLTDTTGYIVQVSAYAVDGTERLYSAPSNQIYLKLSSTEAD